MDDKDYKVISNISIRRKRVLLTLIAFLLSVAFVFVIFYLVIGRKTDAWLDGTSGLGRTSVFPFIFTSGDELYSVDENLVVHDIDNNTSDAVYDNDLGKLYYIYKPSNTLYEYDIKNDSRTLLCSGVYSFKLFKERTVIPYVSTDGAIMVYSLNSKASSVLREPVERDGEAVPTQAYYFTSGKLSIVYYDEFNFEDNTAALKQWFTTGDVVTLSSAALIDKEPVIFTKDSAVSYFTKDGLCITAGKGETYNATGTSNIIKTNEAAYAEMISIPAEKFDNTKNIKFYYTVSGEEDNTSYTISSLNISGNSVSSSVIAENVDTIINYNEKYSNVIYSVKSGDVALVYSVRPGVPATLIAEVPSYSGYYYEDSSNLLYILVTDRIFYTVDVFDKNQTKYEIPDMCGISPYFGKPFSVIYSDDNNTKNIVLKQTEVESYPSTETRLYGKSDTVYLKLRQITGSNLCSLDIHNGDTEKRITNSCLPSSIVYDKKISTIIYYNNGTLYSYIDGVRTEISDFEKAVIPVAVLTE